MRLEPSDFGVSAAQLQDINHAFSAMPARYAPTDDGEEEPATVCVTFEFSPLGRSVTAHGQGDSRRPKTVDALHVKRFTAADVTLTPAQMQAINHHFSAMTVAPADAAEDAPQRASVTFEFGPGWRSFQACFDRAEDGELMRHCYEWPPDSW